MPRCAPDAYGRPRAPPSTGLTFRAGAMARPNPNCPEHHHVSYYCGPAGRQRRRFNAKCAFPSVGGTCPNTHALRCADGGAFQLTHARSVAVGHPGGRGATARRWTKAQSHARCDGGERGRHRGLSRFSLNRDDGRPFGAARTWRQAIGASCSRRCAARSLRSMPPSRRRTCASALARRRSADRRWRSVGRNLIKSRREPRR